MKQAGELGGALPGSRFDHVYASPLERALTTADIVTDHTLWPGLISREDRLVEPAACPLEGRTFAEMERTGSTEIRESYRGSTTRSILCFRPAPNRSARVSREHERA